MKLFNVLCLALACVAQTTKSHTLSDATQRIPDNESEELQARLSAQQQQQLLPILLKRKESATSTEILETPNFKCTFYCLEDYHGSCQEAKKDFSFAFETLSNTFEFKHPVIFEAYVDNFSKYGIENIAGAVMDQNYIPLKTSQDPGEPPYLYPRALAKQLNLDQAIDPKKNDFIMILNNFRADDKSVTGDTVDVESESEDDQDAPSNASGKGKKKRTPEEKQAKIEEEDGVEASQEYGRKIVHEMIHGMGFGTLFKLTDLQKSVEGNGKEQTQTDANTAKEEKMGEKLNLTENTGKEATESKPLTASQVQNLRVLPSRVFSFDGNVFERVKNLPEFVKAYEESTFYGFTPLTIFSKYIVDVKNKKTLFENLGFLYQELNGCFLKTEAKEKGKGKEKRTEKAKVQEEANTANFGKKGFHLRDFEAMDIKQCYESLSEISKKQLTDLAQNYFMKANSIGFLTAEGSVIPLQTFDNQFYDGTSVDHVEAIYINSNPFSSFFMNKNNLQNYYDAEFLMYYTEFDDFSLETLLESLLVKSNKHGLIGPGTVNIMKTLGWTEKGEASPAAATRPYYVAKDVEYPEQNKFKYLLKKEYELTASGAFSLFHHPRSSLLGFHSSFSLRTLLFSLTTFLLFFYL